MAIQIGGEDAPRVSALLAGQIHHVRINVNLPKVRNARTLRLFPVSALPADAYDLTIPEITLSPTVTNYYVDGTLLFKYPQAKGSGPVSIRLAIEMGGEEQGHSPEIFGNRTLTFRVVDKEAFHFASREQEDAYQAVAERLEGLVPTNTTSERESELAVVLSMTRYAARHLQDPWFTNRSVTEKDFQRDLSWYLSLYFDGERVLREVKAGRGFVDVLVQGVPLELKLAVDERLEDFVRKSLPQVTQYIVSCGRRVGILAVLDLAERRGSSPPLASDVDVLREPGEGLRKTGPVAVVTFVIRGALNPPSTLLPRES